MAPPLIARGAKGKLVLWANRVTAKSSMAYSFPGAVRNGHDPELVEDAMATPYAIPNVLVDSLNVDTGIPVDCGPVVNPAILESQMESAIVYGLTAALWGEVHVEKGRVVEGNFDTYRMLRMREMPVIEVHIVPSTDAQGEAGEPGTPPIATNARPAAWRRKMRIDVRGR